MALVLSYNINMSNYIVDQGRLVNTVRSMSAGLSAVFAHRAGHDIRVVAGIAGPKTEQCVNFRDLAQD